VSKHSARFRRIRTFAVPSTVALVLGVCLFGVFPANVAVAGTIPSGPTDPNFCADYGQTSAGAFDGIEACTGPNVGPVTFIGDGGATIESDTVGFQCVELATRYLYSEFDIPVQDQQGYQVVDNYWTFIQNHPSAGYPLTMVTPSTATAGSLAPGDVVSYGDEEGDDGHDNIVVSTNPSPFDGTGTINTLNENEALYISIKVTNWQFEIPSLIQGVSDPATGWLHATGGSSRSSPANLLTSASFESDNSTGWSLTTGANVAEYDNGTAHDGQYYLEMNTGSAGVGASLYQDVATNTTAGQSFSFSVWMRSADGSPVGVCVALWGLGGTTEGGGSGQDCTNLDGSWTLLTASLDTHASAHNDLRAQIYMDTANLNYDVDGATLDIGNAQTDQTSPGAPTAPTVTAGDAQAAVSWSAPSNDGGAPVTSYTVTPVPACPSCTGLSITGTPPATQTTVGGLTDGTSYTFTVTATNTVGPGSPSSASNAVIPGVAPAITTQPTNQAVKAGQTATLTAAASGKPSPTVQWQVSTNGGVSFSTITGATSGTYSFTATTGQSGDEYRAVFSNALSSATTSAATLTVISGSTPTITKFGPAKGKVGKKVTITGTNLSGATQVTFNGTPATVITDKATKIVTTVPTGATTGTITVTAPGGTATSAKTFKVT
jgi:hypothetical protein